jgi:hypothetical protein
MKTLVCGTLCLAGFWGLAVAQTQTAGTVKVSQGTATVERQGQMLPLRVGGEIWVSDKIMTGADGSVGITLRDNTMLSAGPNAVLHMNKFVFNSSTNAGVIDASVRRGTVSVISGKIAKASPDSVSFSTPSMTLAVRGTHFIMDAGQDEK